MKKQPPGYLGFTQADPISSHFPLKVPTRVLLVLSLSRQREGLPWSSVFCLVCVVVGLHAAGVAEAKPFPPLWGAWLDPVELGWLIQPGSGVGSPSPLSHLPEFLGLTSVFSLTCYLLDTA